MLAVIFSIKKVRKLGANFFIVKVPRAGPRSALASLPFNCVANVISILPGAKPLFDPVIGRLGTISRHRLTQHRGARLALISSQLVKPLDLIIGQIGKDASH